MVTYRLRISGLVGVLLPVLLGVFLGAVGADAVVRAGGALAWLMLVAGAGWTLAWLRLPWALRLSDAGSVTFLGPLRRTTVPVSAIERVVGRWAGGMNRWFLSSVWLEIAGRRTGLPLPVGFGDPEAVRDHLSRLNPDIRMEG